MIMFNPNGGFVGFPFSQQQMSYPMGYAPPQIAQPLAWLAPMINPSTLDSVQREEDLDLMVGRNRHQVEIWKRNNSLSPPALFMQIEQLWQHYEFLVESRRRKLRFQASSRPLAPASVHQNDSMPNYPQTMPPLPPPSTDDEDIPPPPPECIPPPPGECPLPPLPPSPAGAVAPSVSRADQEIVDRAVVQIPVTPNSSSNQPMPPIPNNSSGHLIHSSHSIASTAASSHHVTSVSMMHRPNTVAAGFGSFPAPPSMAPPNSKRSFGLLEDEEFSEVDDSSQELNRQPPTDFHNFGARSNFLTRQDNDHDPSVQISKLNDSIQLPPRGSNFRNFPGNMLNNLIRPPLPHPNRFSSFPSSSSNSIVNVNTSSTVRPSMINTSSLVSPGGSRRQPLMMDDCEELSNDGPFETFNFADGRPAPSLTNSGCQQQAGNRLQQPINPGAFSLPKSPLNRPPNQNNLSRFSDFGPSRGFHFSETVNGMVDEDQEDQEDPVDPEDQDEEEYCGYVRRDQLESMGGGRRQPEFADSLPSNSYYRRSGLSTLNRDSRLDPVELNQRFELSHSPESAFSGQKATGLRPQDLRKPDPQPVVYRFDHSLILPHKYGSEFGRSDFLHDQGNYSDFNSQNLSKKLDREGVDPMPNSIENKPSSSFDYDYDDSQPWESSANSFNWEGDYDPPEQEADPDYYEGLAHNVERKREDWDEATLAAFERFVGGNRSSDQMGYTISGAPPPPPPRPGAGSSDEVGRIGGRYREDRRRSRSRSPSGRRRIPSRDSSLSRARDDHVSGSRERERGDRDRDRERERGYGAGRERDYCDKISSRDERERDIREREFRERFRRDRDREQSRPMARGAERGSGRRSPADYRASTSRRSRSPPSRSSSHRDSPNTIYRSEFGGKGGPSLPSLLDPLMRGGPATSRPISLFGTGNVGGSAPKVETVSVEDILNDPGRSTRPPKIVVVLRGAPGAGKSYIAKLIKDREVEKGGAMPRILCLDDYFMVENEKDVIDARTGRRKKERVMQYEYDADLEPSYRKQFFKSYKKTIDDGFFNFIIVDAVNQSLQHFDEMWSVGKHNGYQVYIVELKTDAGTCARRNIHNRTKEEINQILQKWEPAPPHFYRLDCTPLIQDASIQEVDMDADDDNSDVPKNNVVKNSDSLNDPNNVESVLSGTTDQLNKNSDTNNDSSENPVATNNDDEKNGGSSLENNEINEKDDGFEDTKASFREVHASKWDLIDSEAKLDKLDGMKLKKGTATMADFLEVSEDYRSRTLTPGKKRVRWADIESRQQMEREQAIGFVIGGTNWSKLTGQYDPSGELERTKYF